VSKRAIREHLNAHIERVSTSLGCVTHTRVTAVPIGPSSQDTSFVVTAGGMQAFRITRGAPFWLTVIQTVRIDLEPAAERARAEITGYSYRIGYGEGGSRELLGYHFDPFNQESGSHEPHLHVGRTAYRPLLTGRLQDFHKRHIPTGHVSFPSVVRFLIEELGVEPVKPGWERLLMDAGAT